MAKKGFVLSRADLSRDASLAGKTVSKGGMNITYDDQGFAKRASNYNHKLFSGTDRSVAAPSSDTVKSTADRGGYGGSSYDQSHFSDSELMQAAELRAMATSGKIPWSEAHDYVERVRGKYGYSGGSDGGGYIRSTPAPWNPQGDDDGGAGGYGGGARGAGMDGGFSYDGAPGYVNRYQGKIDDLTAQILGREAFSYNPELDPAWQQYRESYTRGGQRAMQDTLGQMAARTGGLASSYAGNAAQQSYDGYMSAMADKIPELRQLAYSMYQDEGDALRGNLNMLTALEQGDYAKFADRLGQYNTDRNFDYGVYRDSIGDQRYAQEWNYQAGRDQAEEQLARAQLLASIGDFSGYKALGYSDAEIEALQSAYDRAQAAAVLRGRKSGESGGSGGEGPSGVSQDYAGLFNAAYQSGTPESYIANNYKQYGFNSKTGLSGEYKAWADDSGKLDAVIRSVNEIVEKGDLASLDNYLESTWDTLSGREREQVQALLDKYEIDFQK